MQKLQPTPPLQFAKRETIFQVEEGSELAPKFGPDHLIPAITTDFETGHVLMLGFMNEEALKKTIALGEAVYFSRSRKKLWHKGAESGFVQKIVELRVDDDQDAIWLRVRVTGASCHVGYRSCFFRSIPLSPVKLSNHNIVSLHFEETEKVFDPKEVYKHSENPTKI